MTDIMKGDVVQCCVGYYKSYKYGELAVVKRLDVSDAGNPMLILENELCDYGESQYKVDNWKFHSRSKPKQPKTQKEHHTVGFVKTKYFGIEIMPFNNNDTLPIAMFEQQIGWNTRQTQLRDSKADVVKDIREIMQEGEQWAILQTCAFVELAQPKPALPPIQLTECK